MQYSKALPIVTCLIFIACLAFGFYLQKNNVMDTTYAVTAVTVSGGIFGTTVLWYMKKAQSENNIKLRGFAYEKETQERIKYLEKEMELKVKYGEVDNTDFTETALSNMNYEADSAINESMTPIEQQNY